MKHRSHTAAGLIKSTTSVSIFTPLNTTTLLQKQTLLSQKHRLYLRRILPYQKYHLLRHRSHPSWNRHQFRRIHLSNHPCQHRLYLKFRLSSHPKYPWTRPNPLSCPRLLPVPCSHRLSRSSYRHPVHLPCFRHSSSALPGLYPLPVFAPVWLLPRLGW